ncbi:unnamed protein product [Lactuca virosa]|uniref:Uncharacterized protein n=1 Tax=Lactuca virosa TaxID=75947 RepID=A0AAU9NK89_9ASTR|nr:unnamed protein product [Lactuca virosa]
MLEELRFYMMDILYNMTLKGQQWGNHICSEIRDKGSRGEPQQHEEVEMTHIKMDTTQNDMQATPNDVESSSAWDFSQYMKVTPPRSYEGEEGVVGEEVVGANVQVDEVIPNVQVVANVHIQEVVPIVQV